MGLLKTNDLGAFLECLGWHGALHGDGVDDCGISLVRLIFALCSSRCSDSIAFYFY